jgi:hypothetical protein
MAKNVVDWRNEGFLVVSQLQSITLILAGFNLRYHANANTAIDKPIKYGLAGSINEKLAAMLLLPASNAITGVIQHSEAAIAVRIPAPVNVPVDFILIIPFPVFESQH